MNITLPGYETIPRDPTISVHFQVSNDSVTRAEGRYRLAIERLFCLVSMTKGSKHLVARVIQIYIYILIHIGNILNLSFEEKLNSSL